MSDALHVDITQEQQDLLLRGLRFVRRSVQLDDYDPTPELVLNREDQLAKIASLVDQLNGSQPAKTTAGV